MGQARRRNRRRRSAQSENSDVIVPDVIASDLQILFVGVNPGIRSGKTRHHFAHPSSRLWVALREAGFTPELLRPAEESALLGFGLGLTNLVDRPTRAADELTPDELRQGGTRLRRKACRYRPGWVAILGVMAYRIAFDEPDATVGLQSRTLCSSRLWVLPGPTGRNAHYPLPQLIEEFRHLRCAVQCR
jgi:double-stranded uracil-DNA glycosylase